MTRQRRLHASRRSIPHFMLLAFVSGVRHIRSKRARSRPTPGGSRAFRQHAAIAQLRTRHRSISRAPSHWYNRCGCAKKSGRQFTRSRCAARSRPNTCTRVPQAPLPRVAEDRRTSGRSPESRQCMGWIEDTWIHQNHQPRPALASPTWHHCRCRDSHLHAP
jgi:hypothetical protein